MQVEEGKVRELHGQGYQGGRGMHRGEGGSRGGGRATYPVEVGQEQAGGERGGGGR